MKSNFIFLKQNFDENLQGLFSLSEEVEKSYINDMYSTVFRSLRPVIEETSKLLADQYFIELSQTTTFNSVLKQLRKKNVLPESILNTFHELKNQGNIASHNPMASFSKREALTAISELYGILVWLVNTKYSQNVSPNFHEPVDEGHYSTMAERKIVYVQTANNSNKMWPAYEGLEKIGETSTPVYELETDWTPNSTFLRSLADKRVAKYMKTSGVPYIVKWAELAWSKSKKEWFHDYDVHNVLLRSNYQKSNNVTGNEWFEVDLETTKKAIRAVKEGRKYIDGPIQKADIILRPEQDSAVSQTRKIFKNPDKMLWNAKMRFGKTVTALELIKQEKYKKILIMTHRPVVSDSWFEDFGKMKMKDFGYQYSSKKKGEHLENLMKSDTSYIYFASIQDLRDSKTVNKKGHEKNELIFNINWDLVIIDEAHEGTQTELAVNVIKSVTNKKTRLLELSGTPFNLINDYDKNHVYTWDYIMEQEAKLRWDSERPNEKNPYEKLPKVSMYTFTIKNNTYFNEQKSFNFKEFFRILNDGTFVHESDVNNFLNEITKEDEISKYPFSTPIFREKLRHTLWLLPGVKEAKALTSLLRRHPVFGKEYDIINIVDKDSNDNIASYEINDAGQNDVDRVRRVITKKPYETKTITISVRRLTTGVNVPEWTAIMFLNNTTSAMNYLQAAFRVQTPYSDKTGMKQNAYIFDFAPDRALTIMAESTNLSTGMGKLISSDQRIEMGRLLNFLPIIGNQGNGMQEYKVDKLLTQIKHVYAEKAVRSGFDDDSLYSDELLKLDEIDINEFRNLQVIIGSTNKEKIDKKINVNKQGLTEEEYNNAVKADKKNIKERTQEEQEIIDKMNSLKNQRKAMISILRGISIRIPMMIYGMQEGIKDDITIDNFIDFVDDQSWKEFMPKGVTKGMFSNFKKYYDTEVFIEAGRIIRTKVKELDNLDQVERAEELSIIFNSFKNPDKETVLTPWKVVNNHMVSTLGGLSFYDETFQKNRDGNVPMNHWVTNDETEIVFQPETKILEINSKTGLYPLYMAISLYWKAFYQLNEVQAGKFTIEDEEILWQKILLENIYVIAKTPMAKAITERTLTGYRNLQTNVKFIDKLIDVDSKSKIENGIQKVEKEFGKIKFDVVIGNPPYQEIIGNYKYQLHMDFLKLSFELTNRYVSLIQPLNWLNDKKTLDLVKNHVITLYRYSDSTKIFQGVSIPSGVGFSLIDKGVLVSTTEVIENEDRSNIELTGNYNFDDLRISEEVKFKQSIAYRVSNYKGYSNKNKSLEENVSGDIKIWYKKQSGKKGKNGWMRIMRSDVPEGDIIDQFKVMISKDGHAEKSDSKPENIFNNRAVTLKPGEITTDRPYLLISDNEVQSELLAQYANTKFFRRLLHIQDKASSVPKAAFELIPDINEWEADYKKQKNLDLDLYLNNFYCLSEKTVADINRRIAEK